MPRKRGRGGAHYSPPARPRPPPRSTSDSGLWDSYRPSSSARVQREGTPIPGNFGLWDGRNSGMSEKRATSNESWRRAAIATDNLQELNGHSVTPGTTPDSHVIPTDVNEDTAMSDLPTPSKRRKVAIDSYRPKQPDSYRPTRSGEDRTLLRTVRTKNLRRRPVIFENALLRGSRPESKVETLPSDGAQCDSGRPEKKRRNLEPEMDDASREAAIKRIELDIENLDSELSKTHYSEIDRKRKMRSLIKLYSRKMWLQKQALTRGDPQLWYKRVRDAEALHAAKVLTKLNKLERMLETEVNKLVTDGKKGTSKEGLEVRRLAKEQGLIDIRQQVHTAQVDLNYCHYAPPDQTYICLFRVNASGIIMHKPKHFRHPNDQESSVSPAEKDIKAGILRTKLGEKPPFWYEVEKRMKDGSLDNITPSHMPTMELADLGGKMSALERAMEGASLKRKASWMEEDAEIPAEYLDCEDDDEGETVGRDVNEDID